MKHVTLFALLAAMLLFSVNAQAKEPVKGDADWTELGEDLKKDATETQEGDKKDDSSLAAATQNPIANLISLPFQNNVYFGNGERGDKTTYVMNFQPVVPIDLNDDWILITRTIIPLVYMPSFNGEGEDFGLGDLQFTGWFSPKTKSKFMWGAGPVLRFPTATDTRLGSRKYSAGVSVVGVYSDGPWVMGGLIQNLWSFAGQSSREHVNEMLIQPFINYNLDDGWYLTTSPIITCDWTADSGNKWSVPVGGGIGKIIKIGKLPVNLQLQGYYYVESPANGPDWALRFQIQFLFPK